MDTGGCPATGSSKGCLKHWWGFSSNAGQIDAELDRLAADGRERTPRLVKWTVQATRKPKQRDAGHPVRTMAAGGGRGAGWTRTPWSGR